MFETEARNFLFLTKSKYAATYYGKLNKNCKIARFPESGHNT